MTSIEIKVPAAYGGLGVRCDKAHAAGLRRVALHLQSLAVRNVAAIRNRRVPTRRQQANYLGRKFRGVDAPLWTPTGNLLRSVQAAPIFAKDSVTLTADVPYSAPRHELGISRMPKAPALGIVRRDPFFADAAKVSAPQIAPLYCDGYRAEWEHN